VSTVVAEAAPRAQNGCAAWRNPRPTVSHSRPRSRLARRARSAGGRNVRFDDSRTSFAAHHFPRADGRPTGDRGWSKGIRAGECSRPTSANRANRRLNHLPGAPAIESLRSRARRTLPPTDTWHAARGDESRVGTADCKPCLRTPATIDVRNSDPGRRSSGRCCALQMSARCAKTLP
jgi:hypothetical protein